MAKIMAAQRRTHWIAVVFLGVLLVYLSTYAALRNAGMSINTKRDFDGYDRFLFSWKNEQANHLARFFSPRARKAVHHSLA